MNTLQTTLIAMILGMCFLSTASAAYPACTPKPIAPNLPAFSNLDGGYGETGFKYKALSMVQGQEKEALPCITPQSPEASYNNKRCDTNYRALYGCVTPW